MFRRRRKQTSRKHIRLQEIHDRFSLISHPFRGTEKSIFKLQPVRASFAEGGVLETGRGTCAMSIESLGCFLSIKPVIM